MVRRRERSATPTEPRFTELTGLMNDTNSTYGSQTMRLASMLGGYNHLETGIFTLDLALVGGFADGFPHMLFGAESSGKSTLAMRVAAAAQRKHPDKAVVFIDAEGCIAADTLMVDAVDGSVMTAQEVFDSKAALRALSWHGNSGHLKPIPFTSWFDNGVKPVNLIETASTAIRATDNHRFLVWVPGNSEPSWVRSDEMSEGMYIARPKSQHYDWPDTCEVTDDEARWVGYMLGDGGFNDRSSMTFTNIDPCVIADMTSLTQRLGSNMVQFSDRHFRVYGHSDGRKANKWHKSPVRTLAEKLKLVGKVSYEKTIPGEIMDGTRETVRQCLSGLILTDGTVDKGRPTLSLSTTSRRMAEQVRLLWSRFGILARVEAGRNYDPENHRDQWKVTVNGTRQLRIAYEVLDLIGKKYDRLVGWGYYLPKKVKHDTRDFTPDYFELNLRDRKKLSAAYRNAGDVWWDYVVSVEPDGEVQTYDFTVEGTHNFVCNDMVVHNSYDTNWAEHHGVDNGSMFYAQPSTGEEAVNIAHGVLHSEETSLLILDSLPALAPQEEVDAAVEDKFYALRSQLIARFCQKVIRAKNEHVKNGRKPPTVLMINQWRTKIGFVMGDPRKLPGGDQPKYLCHSMIETKNKEVAGKSEGGIDIATHNDHSFIVKKSKAANSLREGAYKMIRDPDHFLGAGAIDDADTVITYAKKFGLWTGAGQAQYLATMGDHKFTSMRVGAEFLQDNPDELLRIKQAIIMKQRMSSALRPVPADSYLMGRVDDDLVALL